MPHIFISYAKKDTRPLASRLYDALNAIPGLSAWMDQSLEADSSWAAQIQDEIDRADYVVVLLSPDINRKETPTQARSFVLNEIDYAQQDRKPILPVLVKQTRTPVQIAGVQHIDLTRTPNDPAPIVRRILDRFRLQAADIASVPVARPSPQRMRTPYVLIAGLVAVLALILVMVAVALLFGGDTTPTGNTASETTAAVVAISTTEAPRPTPEPVTPTPTATPSAPAIEILAPNEEATVTVDSQVLVSVRVTDRVGVTQTQLRVNGELVKSVASQSADGDREADILLDFMPTQTGAHLLDVTTYRSGQLIASAQRVITVGAPDTGCQARIDVALNMRSTPDNTSDNIVLVLAPGQEVPVLGRLTSGDWVQVQQGTFMGWVDVEFVTLFGNNCVLLPEVEAPTPEPGAFSAGESAALAAWESSAKTNADWTPVIETFDGVEMVLVPPGCFRMGSEDGFTDEEPVERVCIDNAFWIALHEVTIEQFGGRSGDTDEFGFECAQASSEAYQPRNCVTWDQAREFCEARGERLPTEAEWEYAARGPDGLVYPWGNEWNPNYANSVNTSPRQTFNVGSFSDGASWVGALDMSGNVWEWVSTIYDQERFPYPYATDDGRENLDDSFSLRTLRGGSFTYDSDSLRSTTRLRFYPRDMINSVGFRCVVERP